MLAQIKTKLYKVESKSAKQKLKQIIMPKETSIVKALMIQRTWQISKIAKQDIRLDRMASILMNEYNLSVIHSQ